MKKIQKPVFFLVLFVLYSIAPEFYSINHSSRFDLTKSIVHNHSFQIDSFVKNTDDWSKYNGHYYTNKAPGPSFIGVIPYFLITKFDEFKGIDPLSEDYLNLRLTDAVMTTLPSVFLAFLILNFLEIKKIEEKKRWWMVIFYSVGSIAYVFSTMMWGHQTAALFVFLGFYFIYGKFNPLLSGLFVGLGTFSEYTVGMLVPIFLVANYFENKSKKTVLKFLIGGVPAFILFAWYHLESFGGIFSIAPTYGNAVYGSDQSSAFSLFRSFSFKTLYNLLFGFVRGLFIISPVLIFSVVGFFKKNKILSLRQNIVIGVSFLIFLLFNATFNGWDGGWSSGPRYLVPVIPLVLLGLCNIKFNKFILFIGLIGVVNCTAIASVSTMALPGYNLLFEEIYPKLSVPAKRNDFIIQLLIVSGLIIWTSLNNRKKIPR